MKIWNVSISLSLEYFVRLATALHFSGRDHGSRLDLDGCRLRGCEFIGTFIQDRHSGASRNPVRRSDFKKTIS
jgi:hypothetical protein